MGVGDHALDAGEGGVVADGVDADPDRGIGGHGAGDDSVAVAAPDGLGLAGDHGLVERRLPVGDGAVGGDPATGADQHHIADVERGDRDFFGGVAVDAFGGVGQQLGEGGEGSLGLADGFHLLPVAEEHHRDQGGEFPPEVEVPPTERGGEGGDVGDGDRECDQEHHPGLAVPDLGDAALQERLAAPQVDDGAEHRGHPCGPSAVDRVAEPFLDLR